MTVYTYADRVAMMQEQARQHEAKLVAAWRTRHPEATCRDHIALLLAELEADFGGRHVLHP